MVNIVVYGKSLCFRCEHIKTLLKDENYNYKLLDIDFNKDELLELYPKLQSYPVIFLYGKAYNYKEYVELIESKRENDEYIQNFKDVYAKRFK